MNKIKCPNCGKAVEISEALKHEVEEAVLTEEKIRHKLELETFQKEIEEKTAKKLKDELDFKIKDSANELLEIKEEKKKLQDQLLDMSKSIRELKDQSDKKELENEKKLSEEIEKIREDVSKTVVEKARLRELELEKKLTDTQKALEDAQRKIRQGSQQLQGEIVELDLEDKLKSTFTNDEFTPVPKGVEGADIWQKVRNSHAQEAGSIVWEIKRTKAFSKGWLPKLREDARKVNASECILVTDCMPEGINHYARVSGVWITTFEEALVLATALRYTLIQVAIAKSAASHEDEKLQEIYDYIVSEAFRHKIEAHFESVKYLKEDLEGEKRVMERVWKKREVQIQRLDRSMSQMFGEIQGITGNALPTPKALEIGVGSESEQEELL
ncbi:DUF2130 domain-containing protein [Patescibacteria group bacterium]|nr:DUF2130 domain-containing protein [Patescibacteria group bacterium]